MGYEILHATTVDPLQWWKEAISSRRTQCDDAIASKQGLGECEFAETTSMLLVGDASRITQVYEIMRGMTRLWRGLGLGSES